MRRAAGLSRCAGRARACLPLAFLLASGCAREPAPAATRGAGQAGDLALAVHVYADTGRGGRLEVRPPVARVWLAGVTPARALPPAPALPEAPPDSLPPPEEARPALEVDPGLRPPILRVPGTLALPSGWSGSRVSVELDVRVDESGRVSDALPVPAAADSARAGTALVEAARRCALGMRFYPALQAGRPVPVWCRQRFDFGGAPR